MYSENFFRIFHGNYKILPRRLNTAPAYPRSLVLHKRWDGPQHLPLNRKPRPTISVVPNRQFSNPKMHIYGKNLNIQIHNDKFDTFYDAVFKRIEVKHTEYKESPLGY